MAGTQGFEPRYADPESAVLPLDDVPVDNSILTEEAVRIQAAQGTEGVRSAAGDGSVPSLVRPRRGYAATMWHRARQLGPLLAL